MTTPTRQKEINAFVPEMETIFRTKFKQVISMSTLKSWVSADGLRYLGYMDKGEYTYCVFTYTDRISGKIRTYYSNSAKRLLRKIESIKHKII